MEAAQLIIAASSVIGATHVVAHLGIFAGYVGAFLRVPQSFEALIYLRKRTLISGMAFFLTCGLTHLFLGVYESNVHPVVTVTDHIQLPAIICFLIFLAQDLRRAMARLEMAFKRLHEEFGTYIATRMTEVIRGALRDPDAPR